MKKSNFLTSNQISEAYLVYTSLVKVTIDIDKIWGNEVHRGRMIT